MSRKGSLGLWVAICLLGGTPRHARAADAAGPAPVVVGTWESQTSGNAYHMQVTWNPAAGRYEGRLIAQGRSSQLVGFPIGELCWTATPSDNHTTLNVFEELRSGRAGVTSNVTWRKGLVYLDRSTPAQLLTSIEAFRRAAETTTGSPTSSATSSAHFAAFPPADEVMQRISGRDPLDTAARQFAALKSLADVLNGVRVANQDERRASYALYRTYSEGQGRLRRQFGAAGEPLAQSYLKDEQFTHYVTHVVFPAVGDYVDAKAKAIAGIQAAARAEAEAKAEARAAAERAAAEKAAEEEKAQEAARQVEVNLTGTWTGGSTIAAGLFDCKSAGLRSGLFQLSRQGRTIRAVTVESNACVPARSLVWEGQLPKDTLIVGDLPLSFDVQVFAVVKGGKRKALPKALALTVMNADGLSVDEIDFPFVRGDKRKVVADVIADVVAARKTRQRRGGASAPVFDADAYMRDGKARMEQDIQFYDRQDRIQQWDNYQRRQDESNNGGCSDCGGVAPVMPNVEQPE